MNMPSDYANLAADAEYILSVMKEDGWDVQVQCRASIACKKLMAIVAALRAAEQDRKEAQLFRTLQNMPAKVAQSFFWNYSSRKERAKAIAEHAALAEEKKP